MSVAVMPDMRCLFLIVNFSALPAALRMIRRRRLGRPIMCRSLYRG